MDDFLPRPLVDEQPGTLISERDFSDYPLHLLTEEQAMTQHYPSSTLMVSTGYETTNQPDLIAIPALGAPPHQKLQPQIATFHGGVSYAMLPPCVPLSHKTTYGPRYGPSRQNTVSKRGKLSEAQRKEIRAYSLKNRSANQKAIADKFGRGRSTISRILREDKPQTQHQKATIPRCEKEDPSTFAIFQPKAATREESHIGHYPMPAEQQSLQPFENGSSEDVIPTKEEARHALAIAIQGLEIHAKGLNENEYLFFQKLGCYLDISSVN